MAGSSPKSPSAASPRSPQSLEAAQSSEHAQIGAIEADEEAGEEDSTLGFDAESSTASLSSSILNYRTINGRTYHSERGNAAYWGANDERQSEAMDIRYMGYLAMEEAGFVHIKEWNGKCPMSPWPKDPKLKEIGRFGQVYGT
ncbi:hypothetical protein CEP52_016225 [Fusarium oligoseptatum]|uniref:Uncharacterized protein n=1 Tax=Fusarium oligoseptatum TaxID=2604345 RepID=A0A428S5Q7_9HYPO|nr:hypothetical protein CEP52_016225 [Fusarium oligoseptatum]